MPGRFAAWSGGFRRWTVLDGTVGSVHQDFGICELDSGGFIDTHIHSFEESFFVLSGEVVCHTHEGAFRLREGDYGVVPVGAAHAWRNDGSEPARWAEMLAPQARLDNDGDTWPVDRLPDVPAIDLDARDPRNRSFGTVQPGNMEVGRQTQDHLAASASMRTALLVYSGITVKMMVDSDLGAFLSTMFMVQYEPGGFAGAHDHPFEETFLIVEGETDAVFDGEHYRLTPGDVAWAGVGCIHEFANATDGPVRWLETQAPQPPARHSYRFDRDWAYLTEALE
ncbi:MAG: cupin domain-containing protein [Acidobacteria bacterium]|nr:cupin domain-containing protein [Acidobacteriota bacterium]